MEFQCLFAMQGCAWTQWEIIASGHFVPKAGFGEAPQQAFSRPLRDVEMAGVSTPALLAGTIKVGNDFCLPRVCGGVALKGTPY